MATPKKRDSKASVEGSGMIMPSSLDRGLLLEGAGRVVPTPVPTLPIGRPMNTLASIPTPTRTLPDIPIEEAALRYSFGNGPLQDYDPRVGMAPPPQDQLSAFGQTYTPTRGSYSLAPVIQQTPEQRQEALDAQRQYDLNTIGPEGVAAQDAAIAKSEMEKAKAGAYEARYEAGSIPELGTGALQRVELPDGKGGTIVKFLTREQALAGGAGGQGFAKPAGKIPAQVASRIEAAHAAMASAEVIKQELRKPEVRAALGPMAGRISNIQELIGNPPPELAKLAGALDGYFFNTMGVHGMRSAEAAQKLKSEFGHNFTPEAMEARLEGLNEIPAYFASLAPATRSDLVGDQPSQALPQPTLPDQVPPQQANSAPRDMTTLRSKYKY